MHLTITPGLLVAVVVLTLCLRRTLAELRTVADHAPSAIAHVEGREDRLKYRFVNQRYAALDGRQPSEVIGKHPKDVLGPDIFARSHGNMLRAITGETVTFDLELGEQTAEVVYNPDVPPPGLARGGASA